MYLYLQSLLFFYANFNVINQSIVPTTDTEREFEKYGLSIQCHKTQKTLEITIDKNGHRLLKQVARSAFKKSSLSQGITNCFDVTENLIVTGHADGGLYVWDASNPYENPVVMRNLKGHIADVYMTKFFPSKTVILSGGADIALKIWTILEGGLCVAELKGHKRGVLSSDMIDRGRNLVSTSFDGTAILWDVPTQSKVHSWGDGISAINYCHISPLDGGMPDDKLLVLSCESGFVLGCDVRQRSNVFTCKGSSPINCALRFDNHYLVSGEQYGIVKYWDIRNTTDSVKEINIEKSIVTKLLHCRNNVWIATGNGNTYNWDPRNDLGFTSNLISDTEPINGICERKKGEIATISRRGVLRLFSIPE